MTNFEKYKMSVEEMAREINHIGNVPCFPCKRKFKSMTVSKWCDPEKVPKKYILVDVTNDEEYAKKRFCCNKCKQVYEEGER